MHYRFDPRKAMQAAAALLRAEETRQMGYLRLLKLLYIADRESIRDTGRPITGDHVVAMKYGPVLGGVYDLIRGTSYHAAMWSSHLQTSAYLIKLTGEVGTGALCRYELEKLMEVSGRYAAKDDFDLAALTHEFAEWKQNYDAERGAKPIPPEDILSAVGRADDIDEIAQDAKDRMAIDRAFEGR